jgi:hypothetical protein
MKRKWVVVILVASMLTGCVVVPPYYDDYGYYGHGHGHGYGHEHWHGDEDD